MILIIYSMLAAAFLILKGGSETILGQIAFLHFSILMIAISLRWGFSHE